MDSFVTLSDNHMHMNTNALLTALVVVVVFVGGFAIGRATSQTPLPAALSLKGTFEKGTQDAPVTRGTQTSGGGNANTASLSEGQLKMLASFGIDPDTVTITPQMVACAEAKLGAARIEELKNGATPSMSEGISLMACYK